MERNEMWRQKNLFDCSRYPLKRIYFRFKRNDGFRENDADSECESMLAVFVSKSALEENLNSVLPIGYKNLIPS